MRSAGEDFLSYSKSLPDITIVGENSGGVGTFGEIRSYVLPNSKIRLNFPSKIFLSKYAEEGIGFLPDYWLDSSKPEEEVSNWLNDPQNYQFNIEKPSNLATNIDFEEWSDGLPTNWNKSIGAQSGNKNITNIIEKDNQNFVDGKSSLKISGNKDVDRWYFLEYEIPYTIKKIKAEYFIKGFDIKKQENQFNNCYVGFIFSTPEKQNNYKIIKFDGTFDWKKEFVDLDINNLKAYNVRFVIFLSKSGTLWLDNVLFKT